MKLVNNGIVTVGDPSDTLSLTMAAKSGSGSWEAKTAGFLSVDTTVSGSGTWYLTDPPRAGGVTVAINAPCTSLSGDVLVNDAAVMDINENFSTTGELSFRQRSIDVLFPEIHVAQGKTAEFSVPAP